MGNRRLLACGLAATLTLLARGTLARSTDNGTVAPAVQSAARGPQSIIASGTIASDDTPTMPDRLFRDVTYSQCPTLRRYPGTLSTGAGYAYKTVIYTNHGPARCVTLTMVADCTGGDELEGVFLSAYAGPFDPANLATNYLGDSGISIGAPTDRTLAIGLPLTAEQTITLVVNQVNGANTTPPSRCAYELSADDPVPVPTISPLGILLTALGLAGVGAGVLRRRL